MGLAEERNRLLDALVSALNAVKGNGLVRVLAAPIRQAQYTLGDIAYAKSPDSRKVAELKDTHVGERCFVVGNGPSLRTDDLDHLKDEFCFGANRVFQLFDKTMWRPNVYLATDREFLASDSQRIVDIPVDLKLIGRMSFTKSLEGKSGVVLINSHTRRYTIQRFSNDRVDFSRRPDLVLNGGFTVTHVALQLAMWMGFSEIYLIGMDHTFAYEVTPDGVVKANEGVRNHAFEDPAGAVINPQPRQGVEFAYRIAKYEAENRGIKILNATRGGSLEVFDRVDLDEVLSKGGAHVG